MMKSFHLQAQQAAFNRLEFLLWRNEAASNR